MSVLSQFFTQGSGGSGFIDIESLILSGGAGGGGGNSGFACGSGGGGAVYYGFISVKPGSTCPITIGAGGAGGGTPTPSPSPGSNGSESSVTTPTGKYRVIGGGGGAAAFGVGNVGGTGGGNHGGPSQDPSGNRNRSTQSAYSTGGESLALTSTPSGGYSGTTISANSISAKNGVYLGFSGGGSYFIGGSINQYRGHTGGGGAGGSAYIDSSAPVGSAFVIEGRGFNSDISGTMTSYGAGGYAVPPAPSGAGAANTGKGGGGAAAGGVLGSSGGSGIVILRYPTQFAAAPAFPGATDLSPSTPGYRTYQFTSPGSITLP